MDFSVFSDPTLPVLDPSIVSDADPLTSDPLGTAPSVSSNLAEDTLAPLQVTNFEPTPSGFAIQFNQSIDPQQLNLYDGDDATEDLPDLRLEGETVGAVAGSVVHDELTGSLTFVKTGDPLAPDFYTVSLASRSDGFIDQSGNLLDGDGDGTAGGDYVQTFRIDPPSPDTRLLQFDDVVRGPAQIVEDLTQFGLPIHLDDGDGLTQISFEFVADSDLLLVTGVEKSADLPEDWTLTVNLDEDDRTFISLQGSALPGGALDLVSLVTVVPGNAAIGSSQVLSVENLSLNGGDVGAISDQALQQVAYFGDANGSGEYTGLDASLIARVAVGLDTGFDFYDKTDPLLIGDTNSNGGFSGLDASFTARKAVGLQQDEIPDLPENLVPAGISQISPANGEEMVNLTREAVVRFSERVNPATINSDSIKVISLGEEVLGRWVVSSTERFATFFPDEPWFQSAEIRIDVDGRKILGRDGQPLDGDGDGVLGGDIQADFTTLPLTRIAGTDVFGFVFDSFNTNPDGSNIPVVGATIRVDAFPEANAVTDENGFFRLEDVPAPEFSVHIDGSTAVNAPAGTSYATVGKLFHSVPGQETQLTMDGATLDIFLPPMSAGDVQDLASDTDTEVGFGAAGMAQLETLFPDIDPAVWERVQVTFPAGSAQDEQGNVANQATIIPVAPDRLPAPLPPGLDLPVVISIQAGSDGNFSQTEGGATNFDVPAPVQLPNLDNLAPGEKALIWSFNHDSGEWEVVGTGTVSEDGLTIISDPGVGILAPGWHGAAPGTTHEEMPERDDCGDAGGNAVDAFRQSSAAGLSGLSALLGTVDLVPFEALGSLVGAVPGSVAGPGGTIAGGVAGQQVGALLDSILGLGSLVIGAGADIVASGEISAGTATQAGIALGNIAIGHIPGAGWVATVPGDVASWYIGIDALENQLNNAGQAIGNLGSSLFDCLQSLSDSIQETVEEIEAEANELADRFSRTVNDVVETIDQARKVVRYIYELGEIIQGKRPILPSLGLQEASVLATTTNEVPSEAELISILEISLNQAQEAINFFTANNFSSVKQAFESQASTINSLQQDFLNLISPTLSPASGAFYTVETAQGITISRGTVNESGSWSAVLPPNDTLRVSYYDPVTGSSWQDFIRTGNSGSSSRVTRVIIDQSSGDSDGDGLPDIGELAIGTALDNPDTDGDGIRDTAEIAQGLDPLGGQGFPTGVIANLPLPGTAREVVVEGSTLTTGGQTAYVATGSHGLAVVDASQFNNPILQGQLDLPGDNVDVAIDPQFNLAVVAGQSGGLHLVDVSDPMTPDLLTTLNFNANQVEVADSTAYITVGNSLRAIDLLTGEELERVTLPGSGTVTGLARERSTLYAYTSGSDTLSIIDISDEQNLDVLGQVNVSVASSTVGLFAANGVVHLAGSGLRTVDVSNPSSPFLIGNAEQFFTARDITLNGSNLGLVAAEGQGLGIYDLSDPTDTDAIVTQINTTGFTQDVAIASGIAYVADGNAGLQVINYLSFDNQGQAPEVNISSNIIDLDPDAAGIQVLEGSSLPLQIDVTDDVQVRNVEVLLNGEVVANDVSFPFDVSAILQGAADNPIVAEVQVRAIDTGGNSALSNILSFDLIPDTIAPEIFGTTPEEGSRPRILPGLSVRFTEAIDNDLLSTNGVTLTNLGDDGALGGGDDSDVALTLQLSPSGQSLFILPDDSLVAGSYQLQLDPSVIADNAGNALAEPFSLNFTKRPTEISLTFSTAFTDTLAEPDEDAVYTFEGTAGQRLFYDALVDNFGIRARLVSPDGITPLNVNADSDSSPFTLSETGQYRLIIETDGAATGDFGFRLLDVTNAQTVELGATIEASLDIGTDADLYQFAGTSGQKIFIDSLGDQSGLFFQIYNSANQFITVGSSFNPDLEITFSEDDDYLLIVQGINESAIDYSFRVTAPATTIAPLILGEITTGSISEARETDIYTFDGTAGQKLYLDGLGDDFDLQVRLDRPSGFSKFTTFSLDFNNGPFELTQTGTYELVIEGSGDAIGSYSFRLPDLATATDITLGSTIIGVLDPANESDLYRFEGSAGQSLFFDSLGNDINGSFRIFNPSNQAITTIGLTSDQGFTLTQTGIYTLIAEGFSDNPANYSFQLLAPEITTAPLTLGDTITGILNVPGDTNTFTFEGTAGQRLYFDGLSGLTNVLARLVDPSSSTLFNIGVAQDFSPITLTSTGAYELIVGGTSDEIGEFSFRLLDAANATAITLDTAIDGSLTLGRETDLFSLEIAEGQNIFLDGSGDQIGGIFALYDPNNNFITSNNISSDFEVFLSQPGTYLLAAAGSSNTAVDYSFQIVTSTTTITPLTLGETVNRSISTPGDEDIFTFEGTLGQRLIFDSLDGSFDLEARVISPTGATVRSFLDTDPDLFTVPITLIETGTYQLIVEGNGSSTGNYSFRLSDLANAPALLLGSQTEGILSPNSKADIFTFEGIANQEIVLDISSSPFSANVALHGPGNQFVASSYSDLNVTLPGDGTYIVAVDGLFTSNQTIPIDYSLQVFEPIITTAPLSLGVPVASTINRRQDRDIFTFEGTVGQRLFLIDSSLSFNIDINLINPSGVEIDSSFKNKPQTLTEAGTYQLQVQSFSSDSSQEYDFTLLDATNLPIITDGIPNSGTLAGDETIIFKFQGQAGEQFFLDDLGSDQFSADWDLFSPSNQELFDFNSSFGFDGDILLPVTGTYLLALENFSRDPRNYNFRSGLIDLNALGDPETLPLSLNTPTAGTLSQAGETDIFTFEGVEGQTFFYNGLSGDAEIQGDLFAPNGEQDFSFFIPSVGESSQFSLLNLSQTGTYQLVIDAFGDKTGDYSFQLFDVASAPTINLETPLNGSLALSQEVDVFNLVGTAGQVLSLEDLGSQTGLSLFLYNPEGSRIVADSLQEDFEFTLPTDGTYAVAIVNFNDVPTDYSFQISEGSLANPPIPAITPISLGEIVADRLTEVGDQDIFSFSGTAGEIIYYDILADEFGIDTELISPSGIEVVSTFDLGHFSFDNYGGLVALSETGTYQLLIEESDDDDIGSYSFRLLDVTSVDSLFFDVPVNGTLDFGQAVNLFQFEGQGGQEISLERLSGDEDQSGFYLYGPEGHLIVSRSSGFDITLPSSGTYFLAVDQGFNTDNVNAVEYSFQITKGSTTFVPEPLSITIGETVAGSINNSGEEDRFTFEGTAGQRLTLSGTDNGFDAFSSFSTISRIITPSGAVIFQDFVGDFAPELLVLTETGTYELILDGEDTDTGNYSFRLVDVGTPTALNLDTPINGTLNPGLDSDFYQLTGTAGQTLVVDFLTGGDNNEIAFSLFGPDNQFIADNFDSSLGITLPADGTYLLTIDTDREFDTPLDYTFQVVPLASVLIPLTLGETITGSLTGSVDADIFTFEGTAEQQLYFDRLIDIFSLNIELFSPSEISQGDQFGTFISSDRPINLTETGTYKLVIDSFESTDYSFRLLDVANAVIVTPGTVIDGTLEVSQQADLFTFEKLADQILFFENLLANNFSVDVRIFIPGNTFASSFNSLTDFEIFSSVGGKHLLKIESTNLSTPLDYSFELITPATTTSSLTFSEVISGTVDTPRETDIFTFDGIEGQRVFYNPIVGDFSTDVRLLAPSGSQVGFALSTSPFSSSSPFTLPETGTYQLLIEEDGSLGEYSFELLDITEVNDLALDLPINGSLESEQAIDFFTFEGTANQRLFFNDLNDSFSNGLYRLFGSNNQFITSHSIGIDFEVTLPSSESYLLVVDSSSSEAINYSFEVGVITPATVIEPLTLGAITTGNLERGEEHIFTFEGNLGQKLLFDGLNDEFGILAELISPSGVNPFGFSNFDTSSDSSPVTLIETGTYQLSVINNSRVGDYSFRLLDLGLDSAINLDTPISGTLEVGNETDVFSFTGSEGQKLFFNDLGSTQFNGSYTLYGSGNQFIAFGTTGFNFDVNLPGSGTYVLEISSASSEPLDYSFEIVTPEVTTTALTLDATTVGTLLELGEEDIYTFEGIVGQRLIFDNLSETFNTYAQLLSPGGTSLFSFLSDDSSPLTLNEEGTYQLIIETNGDLTGDYSFRLLDIGTDSAIDLDTAISGTLDPGNESDVFTFEGTAGQRLFFNDLSSEFGGTYILYDPGDQFVGSRSTGSDFDVDLSVSGTYVLIVDGFNTSPVNYTFEIVTPQITTTALTLDETVLGSIGEPGEENIYTFEATTGQRIVFDGLDENFTVRAQLLSPSGNNLLFLDLRNDSAPLTFNETGNYQLVIDTTTDFTGDYSFRILNLNAAPVISLDTPLTGTLESNRSAMAFQVNGTAGDQLVLEDLGSDVFAANWRLYSPDNSGFGTIQSLGFNLNFTLPIDGTHILLLQSFGPSNFDTGNYNFQVRDTSLELPT